MSYECVCGTKNNILQYCDNHRQLNFRFKKNKQHQNKLFNNNKEERKKAKKTRKA